MRSQFHLTPEGEGRVVSGVLFGAMFSSMLSGRLTDKFGRKKVIFGTAILFAIGSIVTAFANTTDLLVAGRVVLGLAIGVASFAAPLYISEMSPPSIRGALVAMNQLAITLGILLSYVVDYGFSSNGNWPAMVACGAVPAVMLGLGIMFLPESPRWLILNDRENDAVSVLKKIRGTEDVQSELIEIKTALSEESGDWREFFSKRMRNALIIGVVLGMFQQFTGINTVIYYAPSIYKLAGLKSDSVSILATAGVGLINVLMTTVSLFLIDRLGRKPLLVIGSIGMGLSLAALSISFLMHASEHILKYVGVGSTLVYVSFFAISLGPVFWLMIAEIYPLRIRGFAMSFATSISWLSNLIVSYSFPVLLAGFGAGPTFAVYAAICVACLIFVQTKIVETKGLSLEQIEHKLGLVQA